VYLSLAAARRAKIFLWGLVLALYGGLGLAGAAAGRTGSKLLLSGRPPLRWSARVICLAALLAILADTFGGQNPRWEGVAAVMLVGGFGAALV
jgi:hypothetical protein